MRKRKPMNTAEILGQWGTLTSQSRGQNASLKPILVVTLAFLGVFLLFLPNIQAVKIDLISNTDICRYDSKLNLDYCESVYEICDVPVFNSQKVNFLYKKENGEYKSAAKDLTNVNIELSNQGFCKRVNITAHKSPFINIDNVPCYDNDCEYKFAWWNASFMYKLPINISSASLASVRNFQVKLQINNTNNGTNWNWTNECIGNSSRARFLNGTENLELPFWVENCSVSLQTMDVWVRIDTNITPVVYTIYLYYGNENALNTSDGEATFIFFDDFLGNSINASKWDTGLSTITVKDSYIQIDDTGGGSWDDGAKSKLQFPIPFVFEHRTWFFGPRGIAGTWDGTLFSNDGTEVLDFDGGFAYRSFENTALTTTNTDSDNVGYNLFRTDYNSTMNKFYMNGSLVIRHTTNIPNDPTNVSLGIDNGGGATKILMDWVFIREFFDGKIAVSFGPEEEQPTNISLRGATFNVSDFSFASDIFVEVIDQNFTSSEANASFLLLSSMNLEKLSGGGSNIVSVLVQVDDSTILEENLRSMNSIGDVGSVGTSPVIFSVVTGTHNISYAFKRTGTGSIQVDNIDMSLIKFISSNDDPVRNQLTPANFNHSDTVFEQAFNWTMNKTINSSTYIVTKQTVGKQTAGSSTLTYFIENLQDLDVSPFWQRFLSSISDIGSMSMMYIDPQELGIHNHSINARQTDAGDTITVNSTIVDFDLIDSGGSVINSMQETNPLTNTTDTLSFGAGTHNIVNFTALVSDGDAFFVAMSSTFKSSTGGQTPTYFINSTNATIDCFSEKQRQLANNNDIGNAFIYTICTGLSTNNNYEFNLWLIVPSGNTVVQLDESLNGFEVELFSVVEINLPPLPNSITNPLNGSSVEGNDIITWLQFFDPNGDPVTYNVTLRNLDGTLNTTIGNTSALSIAVDWDTFIDDDYLLTVTATDDGGLSSNTTISITIISVPVEIPVSIIFCQANGNMFEREVEAVTTNSSTNITTTDRNIFCPNGCTNFSITNFGTPACQESDFLVAIIFVILVLIAVILVRLASK